MRSSARAVASSPQGGEAAPDSAAIVGLAIEAFELLRRKRPGVHCLTNAVAQEFTANMLLAAGASPSMSIAANEIAHFARRSGAFLVNLGTLDAGGLRERARIEALPLEGELAS